MSWSLHPQVCATTACGWLAQHGSDAEPIELRTICCWDCDPALEPCAKTGRRPVGHEAVQVTGFGAEIDATAAEASGCRLPAARRAANPDRLRDSARSRGAHRVRAESRQRAN